MDSLAILAIWLILVLALAGTALWVVREARLAERRFPPTGRFIEVDGVRLHYVEQGAGPPVVLLHGNGARCQDFLGCGLGERLASRYRVIAFDRPGFGYSQRPRDRLWTPMRQAELLAKACAALKIVDPIVVGHSWGTLVTLALALQGAISLRGLVLISGYYFPSARLDAWLMAAPAIPLIGDILRYTISPVFGRLLMRRILRHLFAPQEVSRAFVQAVPPPLLLRPWQLRAAAEESGFMVPAAAALSRRYHQLHHRTEIFAGAADHLVRQDKQSGRLHDSLPHASLHLMPSEGHMLHYRVSDQIAAAVERIARAEPVPAAPPATAGAQPFVPPGPERPSPV